MKNFEDIANLANEIVDKIREFKEAVDGLKGKGAISIVGTEEPRSKLMLAPVQKRRYTKRSKVWNKKRKD